MLPGTGWSLWTGFSGSGSGSAWLRFWVPWWDPVLSDYPRLSQQRKLIASVVVAGFDRVKIAEPGQASTLRLL